jgi:hypothetical protein
MAVEDHAANEGAEKTGEKEEPKAQDPSCDCCGILEQIFFVGRCLA